VAQFHPRPWQGRPPRLRVHDRGGLEGDSVTEGKPGECSVDGRQVPAGRGSAAVTHAADSNRNNSSEKGQAR
jgi:hypothetical protein